MAQLMPLPLPLTVSCSNKIKIGFTFLVPAHLGIPGKVPLNARVCVTYLLFQWYLNPKTACISTGAALVGSSKPRSPVVDGGPRPRDSAAASRPTERLPAYGSATADRRGLPPDGSGQSEPRGGGGVGTSRPVMSSAASAAAQVTFQDPIESEYTAHCHCL